MTQVPWDTPELPEEPDKKPYVVDFSGARRIVPSSTSNAPGSREQLSWRGLAECFPNPNNTVPFVPNAVQEKRIALFEAEYMEMCESWRHPR